MAKIGNFTITDYDENKSDNVELWKYELNELFTKIGSELNYMLLSQVPIDNTKDYIDMQRELDYYLNYFDLSEGRKIRLSEEWFE